MEASQFLSVAMQQIVNGISLGAVYALIAVGFAMVFNVLKFSNFSHGGVLGTGAYLGYLAALYLKLPLIPVLLIGMLMGGLVAVGVEFVAFRSIRKKRGQLVYFFVTSVTMLMLLEQILVIFFGASFFTYPTMIRTTSFSLGGINFTVLYLVMMAVSLLAFGTLAWALKYTKLGIAIRAASNDLTTTNLMGVNVDFIVMATFFVSGMLGGLSGVLLGMTYTLYPQIGQLVVKGFIACVLGGLGSVTGAAWGALALAVVEVSLIAIMGAGLSPAVIFAIMVAFLLVRPQGFAGVSFQEKA
ncbi:MAG: branched-chain amino acid ABC transporter permease [Thermodesulfobacteriota bacterium]